MPIVSCYSGLGNRVSALVHGLLNYDNFVFEWVVNQHLRFGYEELFSPIEGVQFETVTSNNVTSINGVKSWMYPEGHDPIKTKECYDKVLSSLIGYEIFSVDPVYLSIKAAEKLNKIGVREVSLFSDSKRKVITSFLEGGGIKVHQPLCLEMKKDKDRENWDDFVLFIRDWQRMLKSDILITGAKASSSLHPFMASGKELVRLKK